VEVFDGKLGCYPHKKINIRLKLGVRLTYKRPYPVPYLRKETFKRELQHLIREGALRPFRATDWAFPTFLIPKKNDRVSWISDFRELNDLIERPQYPLPRIQQIMLKQKSYKYFTKIDLSMMFYCFELVDEARKELCTIVTPYGKFQYNRLPVGAKISPDVGQILIKKILDGLDIEAYMDDIGIWTDGTFDEHLTIVDNVLERLLKNGTKYNPLKCEWFVQETAFLGY